LIFVTVGALFPFDRLIRLMDELAPHFPEEEFFAQIGRGTYTPRNMKFARLLEASEFRRLLGQSRLLVAHAGMGSVISALEINHAVVQLPRKMELGEHTTDHQAATARWLEGKQGIHIAWEDADLEGVIRKALSADPALQALTPFAAQPFIERLKGYIDKC
jgi:UDP-N-acetylglucosamine transferase subunit ALG13